MIDKLPETLPTWLIAEQDLLSYAEAVKAIHFPESSEQLAAARHRIAFEEVFRLSLASLLNKQANQRETALSVPFLEKTSSPRFRQTPAV